MTSALKSELKQKTLGLIQRLGRTEIGRAKRDLKKKDGYDESGSNYTRRRDMDMDDLFSHVPKREAEKELLRKKKEKSATQQERRPILLNASTGAET